MKYAQNRTDLSIITDVRSKLSNISSELESIDPEYARCVDEDYKVAKHHSFKMVELRKLSQLAEALQMQVELVFCGNRSTCGGVRRCHLGGDSAVLVAARSSRTTDAVEPSTQALKAHCLEDDDHHEAHPVPCTIPNMRNRRLPQVRGKRIH